MTRTDEPARTRQISDGRAAIRLERCVAQTLSVIAAACAEREDAPVKAARRHLAEIYGATRLSRRLERRSASA